MKKMRILKYLEIIFFKLQKNKRKGEISGNYNYF